MSRRKKHDEAHENHERWLLSYADFITLLMIFFIIMYAMSNLDKEKYQQIAAGLNKAMGDGGGANIIGRDSGVSVDDGNWKPTDTAVVEEDEGDRLQEVKKQVDKYLSDSGLKDSVITKVDERGLVLSFKDSLFFDSGKADIKSEHVKKIVDIGKILNSKELGGNYIRVEGHTDNRPINTYVFKSNWDLSVIRATSVSDILISQVGINPQRIAAVGYGEYRPIADNNTDDGRGKNRRVDIIIMSSKFNGVENNKQ